MQFPMFKSYLDVEENEDNSVTVVDFLHPSVSYTLPLEMYHFALQLNGDRDPKTIPGYSESECQTILRELEKANLVRHSRVLEKHFGTVYYTILYKDLNKRLGILAKVWNAILRFSFLPVLFLGLFFFLKSGPNMNGSIFGGLFLGLVVGLVLHEFSHAVACVSCGGTVHEVGVFIRSFLPGAYVLMDPEKIKGKMNRIQVFAAGVEMNLFLGGFFLVLASFLPFDGFFFMAGIQNIFLGILNLCFVSGLDGSRIIGELLGSGSFVFHIKETVFNKRVRNTVLRRPSDLAIIIASAILLICQIALPLLIVDNVLVMIGVFL